MNERKSTDTANAASTLHELKSLSIEKQSNLLLLRLAKQYRALFFGKMNFHLSGHAQILSQGFPSSEATAVQEFFLGAPWKYLESQGHIRDNGQGFFVVTVEGHQAATNPAQMNTPRAIVDAIKLLHPDFQNYHHYFSDGQLKEAVAAAFERYENRLNEIHDASRTSSIKGVSGRDLPPRLFNSKVLKLPYQKLGLPHKRKAYETALCGMLSGSLGWIRNSYTHEKHRLPEPKPEEVLELLFVASYLLRIVEESRVKRA